MESAFTLCPTCEALLRGDETSCPNCGTTFDLPIAGEAEAPAPEPVRVEAADALPGLPPYEFLVLTAKYEEELRAILSNTAADGWELVNVYFGWSMEREASVHFVILRRRAEGAED